MLNVCCFFPIDQSNTQGAVAASTKSTGGPEFKERAAFNRRRGAMRRRVHQVQIILEIIIGTMIQEKLSEKYHVVTADFECSPFRSMDTNLWQRSCVNQRSVHIAKNLFGK